MEHLPLLHPCAQPPTVSVEPPPHRTCHLEQASHIPRPPFCFAESPSSFKSRREPKCTAGATKKGGWDQPPNNSTTFDSCHLFQAALNISFSFFGFANSELSGEGEKGRGPVGQ